MAIDSDMREIYIGKIKELAYQLKSYIVCVSISADDICIKYVYRIALCRHVLSW